MKQQEHFFKTVCALAIPVALQSMLQSSFSMVDQIMIGQLGEVNVVGVGLAGKFASIYSVVISAIGAVAGISCIWRCAAAGMHMAWMRIRRPSRRRTTSPRAIWSFIA